CRCNCVSGSAYSPSLNRSGRCGRNCRVSAGPTIDLPLFCVTGPSMCGLRNPACPSEPATVAVPMSLRASMMSLGGRVIFAMLMAAGMGMISIPCRCGWLPVGIGAVVTAQVRRLPEPEALLADPLLVDVDAQARRVADDVVGVFERVLAGEVFGVVEAVVKLARRGARLEPGEVGNRRREMHGGGGADRPERIVRHEVDVMRLAPAGHLHGLGETADVADVDAVELVDVA